MKYVLSCSSCSCLLFTGALRQIRMLQRPSPKKMSPRRNGMIGLSFSDRGGFHAGRAERSACELRTLRAISLPNHCSPAVISTRFRRECSSRKAQGLSCGKPGPSGSTGSTRAGVLSVNSCKALKSNAHLDAVTASTSID